LLPKKGRTCVTPILHNELAAWAETKPTIVALYVFGSCARGTSRPDADLTIAFEFAGVEDELVELLLNQKEWRCELAELTGLVVQELCLWSDRDFVKPPIVTIYRRPIP